MIEKTQRIITRRRFRGILLREDFNYADGALSSSAPAWREYTFDSDITESADPRLTLNAGDVIGSGVATTRWAYRTPTLGLTGAYSFTIAGRVGQTFAEGGQTALLLEAPDALNGNKHFGVSVQFRVVSTTNISLDLNNLTDATSAAATIANVGSSSTWPLTWNITGSVSAARVLSATLTVTGANTFVDLTQFNSGSCSQSLAMPTYNGARRNVGFTCIWGTPALRRLQSLSLARL